MRPYKELPNLSAIRQARLDARPLNQFEMKPGMLSANRQRSKAKTQSYHRAKNLLRKLGL
jgi:hypothetical protein